MRLHLRFGSMDTAAAVKSESSNEVPGSCELVKADVSPLKGRKRKREDNSLVGELSPCGICLAEVVDQGRLDCCPHGFCFDCIMQWSKVESRCPLCKQRFKRVTRAEAHSSGSKSSLRTPRSIAIPVKDQVYQPSEEDLAAAMEPYANTVCMACLESDNEHLLLLCDLCDEAAHTYCVGLGQQVPDGDWYCSTCSGEREGSSTDGEASVDLDTLSPEESNSGASDSEGGARSSPSDRDSEVEFNLNIELDMASPRREGAASPNGAASSYRLRSSHRAASAQAPREGRSSRRVRVRSREHHARRRSGPSSTAYPDMWRARGSRTRARRAALGSGEAGGEGLARTVQTQVDARLHARLQLVRDQWGSIRRGVLPFPQRATPQHAPQATVPVPPPPGAGSVVERLAWKAMRALQSGALSRGQASRVHAGGEAGSNQQAPGKGQVQLAKGGSVTTKRVPIRRLQSPATSVVKPSGGKHQQQRSGKICKGIMHEQGESGAGGRADTWQTLEDARRKVNAEWVDEHLLQQLQESDALGSSQESQGRPEHADWSTQAAQPGDRPLQRTGGPPSHLVPVVRGSYQQQGRAGPKSDRRWVLPHNWRNEGGARNATVRPKSSQRTWGEQSAACSSRSPVRSSSQGLSGEGVCGSQVGAVPPAPPHLALPTSSSSVAELSRVQAVLEAAGPSWSGHHASQQFVNRSEGRQQVCAVPAAHGQEQGQPVGAAAPASEAVLGAGLAAAKQVKEQLAASVKKHLGPLYKDKVVDRDQFRKVAEGASRALLQSQPAQSLYEKLKGSGMRLERGSSSLRCWCCQSSLEGQAVGQLFCSECIKRQIDSLVKVEVAANE